MMRCIPSVLAFALSSSLLSACGGDAAGSVPPGTSGGTPAQGASNQTQTAQASAGQSASAKYQPVPSFLLGLSYATLDPDQSPPGANVSGCRPTIAHPYPVVLVHGTVEDMEDNFGAIAPILADDGYCVYALNYGGSPGSVFQATGAIASSAQTVAAFVKAVLAQTGSPKVDMVGHSQGGMLLEYIAKLDGLAPKIHNLVALDPSTHGTTVDGIDTLGKEVPGSGGIVDGALSGSCQACVDQLTGSAALAPLDAPPIAQPGPTYTVIETQTDEVVTPPSSAFIEEPGVTNEYIQSFCPADTAEHLDTPYDLVTIQLMLNALTPALAQAPNCSLEFPLPA